MRRAAPLTGAALSPALLKRHPLPPIAGSADKEDRGAVLIVGGSVQVPGAAILAGLAALRAGCGKLAIATDRRVAALVAQALPESLVVAMAATSTGSLSAVLKARIERADAILVGVGMADSPATTRVAMQIARASRVPLVLDAGALAAANAATLPRTPHCVLTPHAGEMAHLTGASKSTVSANAAAIAVDWARRRSVTVVLKGARTYIAEKDVLLRNDRGHPGLGTSGSGDVLAGALAALLARGAEPRWAAAWAVRLHALAGSRLARRIGNAGFLAREIADELPHCLRACGQG